MKYQKLAKMIAATGLIAGPVTALAMPGWAFDNANVPVVEGGSVQMPAHLFDDEHGAGWAFDNPNVPVIERSAGSAQIHPQLHSTTYGAGWAFDNTSVSRVDQESGDDPS